MEDTNNELAKKNRFKILSSINVNDHTEKKNGLTYLSWAWAWHIFKQYFPDSYYIIYENNDGFNYFSDGRTCWVKTGVVLVDDEYVLEHIEYLPVMDYRNASIPLERVTSMDVNKAIQRSLTKAISRHGLGCYIYAGEDLPDESEEEKAAREKELADIETLKKQVDAEVKRITSKFSSAQKVDFAAKKITPIIGQANYKTFNDKAKLTALLSSLKAA